jgi:beta-galactosidase
VQPHYTNVIMPFDGEPPSVPDQNPVGVHRCSVTVPAEWSGRRVVLRVGAAESVVAAYVDGVCVGVGTDSRLPNEFDITAHVRAGRRALVVLVVVRWSAATWLEDQDQWWHGGLQRSVTLHSTAPTHLVITTALPGLLPGPGGAGTLDLDVGVQGAARTERGWTVEASVEHLRSGRAGRQLATTGAMEVPTWNAASEVDQLLSGMFVEPGTVRSRLEVPGVQPWTHETPTRYRLLVTLRDPDGAVVEVASLRTGFRSVQVVGNELLVNGVPVVLHGVNLHEHDPDRGRAVDEALTRRDLTLMKAHNLNAVRAAHYPHDEHLAELCDELGLYLVDEANVESHARQASLCHDPGSVRDRERVERMVRRNSTTPRSSPLVLGNESATGAPRLGGLGVAPTPRTAALRGPVDARPLRRGTGHRRGVSDVRVDRRHRDVGPFGTGSAPAADPVRVLPRHGQLQRLARGLLGGDRVHPRAPGRVHLGVARARAGPGRRRRRRPRWSHLVGLWRRLRRFAERLRLRLRRSRVRRALAAPGDA